MTTSTAALLSHRRWERPPAVTVAPVAAPAGPTAATAVPAPPEPLDDADWQVIRQQLAGRYDEHARVVVRALAEQPGLRTHGDPAGTVGALVAVRAMCLDGGGMQPQSALLARAATIGLLRLPTVFGPVFGTGSWPERAAGTRFQITGFVTATSRAPGTGDGPVRTVVWSVGGRRTDGLRLPAADAVVFPPGSRFVVLAAEPSGPSGVPLMLVRELAGRSGRGDDDVAARLRSAHERGCRA